jgi:hypothetical protein
MSHGPEKLELIILLEHEKVDSRDTTKGSKFCSPPTEDIISLGNPAVTEGTLLPVTLIRVQTMYHNEERERHRQHISNTVYYWHTT